MWEEAFQRIKEVTDPKFPFTSQDKDSWLDKTSQEVGSGEQDPDVEGADNAPSPARRTVQRSEASAGTPLSQFSISPPNLEVPGNFLEFNFRLQ